jgi:hypothetical protein
MIRFARRRNPLNPENDGVRVVDDRPTQYINGFQAGITAVEVHLTLKQTTNQGNNVEVDFTMTPEVAKALYIILGRAITEYEKNYGRIRDIPNTDSKVGRIWPTATAGGLQ